MTDTREYYLYPVVRQGNGFVEPEEDLRPEKRIRLEELKSYLDKHYHKEEARVFLGRGAYSASVFVPLNIDDYSYVLGDGNKIPVGAEEKIPAQGPELEKYFEWVRSTLCYSEGLIPGHETYLWSSFMAPAFRVDSGDDSHERGWEALFGLDRFVLVGRAGTGKTTCLRRMALEYASRDLFPLRPRRIPLYFSLRSWDDRVSILDEVRRTLGQAGSRRFARSAETLLEKGLLVLLFDGLDEIERGSRAAVALRIAEFIADFPTSGAVVATREMAERNLLPPLPRCELLPLSRAQVSEMSYHQLPAREAWRDFIVSLYDEPDVLRVTRNPLMLSITCSEFTRHSTTPHDRARLLRSYVDVIVDEWDSVRGVTRSREPWAKPFKKVSILSRLSAKLFKGSERTFSETWFDDWQAKQAGTGPVSQVLPVLWVDTGLIEPVTDNTASSDWRFTEDIYADLLAALHAIESSESAENILHERIDVGGEYSWVRIWALACGLTQDASSMIRRMLERESLHRTLRALALVDALTQDIVVEKTVVDDACRFVVKVLAQELSTFDVRSVKRRREEQGDPPEVELRAEDSDELLPRLMRRSLVLRSTALAGSMLIHFDRTGGSSLETLTRLWREAARVRCEFLEEDGGRILVLHWWPRSGAESS